MAEIRKYRTEQEIPTVTNVLRDLSNDLLRQRGGVRTIQHISITEDLISEYSGPGGSAISLYDGYALQPVAVKKQLLKPGRLEREREIIHMLEKKDGCRRLLHSVEVGESSYMVMRPCICNLEDLINFKTKINKDFTVVDARLIELLPGFELHDGDSPRPQTLKIIRELIDEMTIRHSVGLVHSKLNPRVIFLAMEAKPVGDGLDMAPLCVRFYDYDTLIHNQTDSTAQIDSTARELSSVSDSWIKWWKSPEQLRGEEQGSIPSDLFVLGLIFHYVLTQGLHPFKNDLEIINGEPVLQLKSSPEAVHLINMLLDKEPNTRTKVKLSSHPLLWDGKKKLEFLLRSWHRVKKARRDVGSMKSAQETDESIQSSDSKCLLNDLEAPGTKGKIFNNEESWRAIVEQKLPGFEKSKKKYTYEDVGDLLRFIKNRMYHYLEAPILEQWEGPLYAAVYKFFAEVLPNLFIEVYQVILKHCSTEQYFLEYFGP